MAPHSSTLAWKIPWMEEPGRLQSMGSLVSDTTEWLHFQFSLSCIGEGNGNPLQCSCLENPRDGGVWWAAIYGIAQSRTRLKWLSSSSCFIDYPKAFVWIITNWGKLLEKWEYQTILPVSWETCMRVKKQELDPYKEQLTGSKLGKEYNKTVYCHPAY